jgi:hypothetical protein
MLIIGFPAAFFRSYRLFTIARNVDVIVGYGLFFLTGTACVAFRNGASLWKIFLWIFLILLLLNLASCVTNAVRFGIAEIH